jgi:hypothetical protein
LEFREAHWGNGLEELLEVFPAQVTIEGNFRKKAGPDDFTGVNEDYCDAAIRMLEEMMAALDANHIKSGVAQSNYDVLSYQPRKPSHVATLIVCTPTKSSGSKLSI